MKTTTNTKYNREIPDSWDETVSVSLQEDTKSIKSTVSDLSKTNSGWGTGGTIVNKSSSKIYGSRRQGVDDVNYLPKQEPLKSIGGNKFRSIQNNAWDDGAPNIIPCPDPNVILANIPITQVQTPSVDTDIYSSKDEWNSIRTEGFEIMQDPEKRKTILHKTCFCRYGTSCQRVKKGINCDFYHSEEERKIPMCPFKHTCRSRKCNHCHPGQEQEWLQKNPLPAGCPKTAPKTAPKTRYVHTLGIVRIEASLFKSNPDAAKLTMQAAMHSGREVMIVQD